GINGRTRAATKTAGGNINKSNERLKKLIDSVHKKLVNVESSSTPATAESRITKYNPNHPRNWTDQQYFDYAEKWISQFDHMVNWRDNDKACPPFSEERDLVVRLNSFSEQFLQNCARYDLAKHTIDYWLKLTPEERYQRMRKDFWSHETSVYMRYG